MITEGAWDDVSIPAATPSIQADPHLVPITNFPSQTSFDEGEELNYFFPNYRGSSCKIGGAVDPVQD